MIKDAPTKVIDDVGQEYDPTETQKEMVDTQDVVYSVISKYGVDEKQMKKIWSKK